MTSPKAQFQRNSSIHHSPQQREHLVMELGPGAVRPAFIETHRENVGIGSDSLPQFRRSVSRFNAPPVLVVSPTQLYDFICPINHGGEICA